jgi:predicted protein tyrosine phosphatase
MRSRTAEFIYMGSELYNTKSAGTAYTAKVKISPELINWADMIFAMGKKQALVIKRKFQVEIGNKMIVTLNIPDCYYFMEPELIEIIKSKVSPYLVQ